MSGMAVHETRSSSPPPDPVPPPVVTTRDSSHLPPAISKILHSSVPTAGVFRQLGSVLERPDIEPAAALEVFEKLASWLKSDRDAPATRHALAASSSHQVLLSTLQRCCCSKALRACACRVIGWACLHHPENAASFINSNAVSEICRLMERYTPEKDLHRHGLYAIGALTHYGGGVGGPAISCEAVAQALKSLHAHRESASVQVNGCELLRSLAELDNSSPLEELAHVALQAKRSFPQERSVAKAADSLLSHVLPRVTNTIGLQMDQQPMDTGVQHSSVKKLGELATYGAVAWRSVCSVAVGRILRAMANHKHDVSLQAIGLWALGRLAERAGSPNTGMCDAAERAKKNHPESALVQKHADQLRSLVLQPH